MERERVASREITASLETRQAALNTHKARLTVSFVPTEEREGISTQEVMEVMREGLRGYPGVQIVVDRNQARYVELGDPTEIETLVAQDLDRSRPALDRQVARGHHSGRGGCT